MTFSTLKFDELILLNLYLPKVDWFMSLDDNRAMSSEPSVLIDLQSDSNLNGMVSIDQLSRIDKNPQISRGSSSTNWLSSTSSITISLKYSWTKVGQPAALFRTLFKTPLETTLTLSSCFFCLSPFSLIQNPSHINLG